MTRHPRLVALTSTGQVSGAERVLIRVLAQAKEAGWQVTCAAPDGDLRRELAAVGVDHIALPELGLAEGSKPVAVARTLRAWARAARIVRRASNETDVVLVNALMALPVVRLARPRPPVVWLAHDVVVRPDRMRLYRWCRTSLTGVIGVSEAVAGKLRGGRAWVEVVHNGVTWPVAPAPTPDRTPDTAPDPDATSSPVVVGLNGLMTSWKGHHVLLDALPHLDKGVRIELMGGRLVKDGEYADGVRSRAEKEGGGRVAVLGHVSDPLQQMRGWDIAVSASTDPEACPLSVLEAMSLGLPVVASDHGGSPEVLAGHGHLVPPGDPVALAAAINRLVADPERRQRDGSAGRARVESHHQQVVQTGVLLDRLDRTVASVVEVAP